MPILPRLKVVTILGTDRYHSIDTGTLRLLNPSIRELKIDFYYSFGKVLKQVRKALTVCFPSIQCLEALSVEVLDLTLVLDVKTLPRLHLHLCYLKLYHPAAPIELSRLRALTALPNLESLNFHLSPWHSEPPNLPMTFPGLRSLSVSCSKFASIGVLLDRVNAPQLQALTIDESHQDSNNMIQIFPGYFRTLVTKCPWLTTLKWYSRQVWKKEMDYSGQWDSGGPLAELLAPLFSYRAMRHFAAVFEGPIVPYTPADFRAIAEAWPDIETLRIRDEPSGDGSWAERHGDLESVVAFASRCPSLRSLHSRWCSSTPSPPERASWRTAPPRHTGCVNYS